MIKPISAKKLIHTDQGKKWLAQFDMLDQEIAIDIANHLTLVSHSEFKRNLLQKLEEVSSQIEGCVGFFTIRELERDAHWQIVPFYSQATSQDNITVNALAVSSDQGSEALVAQIIRQFCKSNPTKFLNHPTINSLRIHKCDAIIFVDDYIGSGNRVNEFLTSFWIEPTIVSWLSGKQINFQVLAYSGTESGIRSVLCHKSKPQVHIYRDAPNIDSFLWKDDKKEAVKKICVKYGRIANKNHKNMWMGYKEGMAALVFEHGCPNNTPAMLWEPNFKGSNWIGLFPNRTISSEVASVFPPELNQGVNVQILTNAGQVKLANSGALLRRGKTGQLVLTALALIAKGQKNRTTLSFATGLNVNDCNRLIEKCIKWNFISLQRRITAKGLAELNAARRLNNKKIVSLDKGSDYYYPRQLREATND